MTSSAYIMNWSNGLIDINGLNGLNSLNGLNGLNGLTCINGLLWKLKEVSKLFPFYDEYLATPNNYPTLNKMRAFESFSWDELNGGHVSIIIDRAINDKEIWMKKERNYLEVLEESSTILKADVFRWEAGCQLSSAQDCCLFYTRAVHLVTDYNVFTLSQPEQCFQSKSFFNKSC
jgi:hypothetical protein